MGGDQGDVAEKFGDLSGPPLPLGFRLQGREDAVRAVAGLAGPT